MTQKSEKAWQEWLQEAEARERGDFEEPPLRRREERLPWAFCALLIGTLGFACWLVMFWLLKVILE